MPLGHWQQPGAVSRQKARRPHYLPKICPNHAGSGPRGGSTFASDGKNAPMKKENAKNRANLERNLVSSQ